MDLKKISEKAVGGIELLDEIILKIAQLKTENCNAGDIIQTVHDQERPFIVYAEGLISLTQASARRFGDFRAPKVLADPNVSPLVKIGDEGENKHYFVAAKKNHVPANYDGEDNPRGKRFTGFSLVASVGMMMTEKEHMALPSEERNKLSYLGATLVGETIYGSEISDECFGNPSPDLKTAEMAQMYADRVSTDLTNVAETVELVRQSLSNEQLNPSTWAEIPGWLT